MHTPESLVFLFGILGQAFNPGLDLEVPYIRTYKPQKGVYMIKINNAADYEIAPYVSEELDTAQSVYKKDGKMKLLINAGFFDPLNGKTISYVIKDKKVVLDPTENEALVENENLKPFMDKILNRGEFRVINCGGRNSFDIAYHNDGVPQGCEIVHSIQAGPILDERMDLEKEHFVIKNGETVVRDSISATKKVSRTAIGLKSNDVYLFVVTDENPMTIEEFSAFMKKKKMEKALAFDGGSSTSFENGVNSITSLGDNLGRKVKSFLLVR